AETGDRAGGSGFFLGVPSSAMPGIADAYVITNRHVIEEGCETIRFSSADGQTHIVDLAQRWSFHPAGDDLAIAPFNIRLGITLLASDQLITREEMEGDSETPNTFRIGSEVLFVGRFMGFDGQESNRPSVRFGNISICPPVVINIPRANQTHPQE